MTFQPGHSGNPSGRPRKGTSVADQIRALMTKKADGTDGLTHAQAIALVTVRKAEQGDMKAIRTVLERTDGGVPQPVEVSGPGGGSFVIEYVNDWRPAARALALPPPGAADRALPGPTHQLAGGGETLAEDDAGDGDRG